MALLNPKYAQDYVPFRFPNRVENNGLSQYNFFYSILSKEFYFKEEKGKLTKVELDFLKVDNLIEQSKITGQRTE